MKLTRRALVVGLAGVLAYGFAGEKSRVTAPRTLTCSVR
jgi:hypothetical protein